jgi:hypothetical protein
MTVPSSVAVSPRHRVSVDEDYVDMIARAPREDFVVRVLTKRTAAEQPLMTGEVVIAGSWARETFPLAARYPLHFRKTYYPGRLHGDTAAEFAQHSLASTLVELPAPIGHTRSTYRSCLLPGTPLDRVSELGSEPEESNIAVARRLPLAAAAGLWRLIEMAFALLTRLHAGGLSHGDAHLHNLIVCPSPLEVLPVDFEAAVARDAVTPEVWAARCDADLEHLLRLAIYVQCALGRQQGALASDANRRLEALVASPDAFLRAIDERTFDARLT